MAKHVSFCESMFELPQAYAIILYIKMNKIILKTGFQKVFTEDYRSNVAKNGRLLFESGHVGSVREIKWGTQSTIEAYVIRQAGVGNIPYKTILNVNNV